MVSAEVPEQEVDEGPFSLRHHLKEIQAEAIALVVRVTRLLEGIADADINRVQVDL